MVVCFGTPTVNGDSFGPRVGSFLKEILFQYNNLVVITVEMAMLQIFGDYRQEGRWKISDSNSFVGVRGEGMGG